MAGFIFCSEVHIYFNEPVFLQGDNLEDRQDR